MISKARSHYAGLYRPPGFEVRRLDLIGLSMFPALWPGDWLDVETIRSLSSGDVVAFVGADGRRLAHRVVGRCSRSRDYLITGDANVVDDDPVPETAMIGRVLTVRRRMLGRWFIVPPVFWRRRVLPSGTTRTFMRLASGLVRFSRGIGAS